MGNPPPCETSSPTVKKTKDRVGTVQIAVLRGFSELVTEMGGNPIRLLARCGLDQKIFSDSGNTIPFSVSSRLLALASEETRCPHFGLLLGQHRTLAGLGPISFLIQNSPTVEDALKNSIRYIHLHMTGMTPMLHVERDQAVISFAMTLPGMVGAKQVLDTTTADLFFLMRMIAGRAWLPNSVNYTYQAPTDLRPYRTLFRAPVFFDHEITSLSFPAYWLERPVPDADPNLCRHMQSYMAKIDQHYSGDLLGQIRSVVLTMLPTGKCTADRIAELFSINRRTLFRRLISYGTTFETMLDEMRYEIATRNLAETNMSVRQLAGMLGYRGSRTFIRAFRRWSGAAPTEWRMRNRT